MATPSYRGVSQAMTVPAGPSAFDGALVVFDDSWTADITGAPHKVSMSNGNQTVVYGASYLSGDTFVAPRDGLYRIEFSCQLNVGGPPVGGGVPVDSLIGAEAHLTGWANNHGSYGFGPMSSTVTPAASGMIQTWPSSSIPVPMHAGDTVWLSVVSVPGKSTDIAGVFAFQYLGPIPA
jgi:hypothetical protein